MPKDHFTPFPPTQAKQVKQNVLNKIPVEGSLETCLFVYGSLGTGKTLILCEALKIKLSQLLSQGRRVRILATIFGYETELLKNFQKKYFVNFKDIEVMDLEELCRDLNIEYNEDTPRDTINRVITSLSDKYSDTEIVTLLLLDEVWPCYREQITPDWRDLEVRENVIWLLGLSPVAHWATSTDVLPPVNSSVLTRHLVYKYRNCRQIRNFIKTIAIY